MKSRVFEVVAVGVLLIAYLTVLHMPTEEPLDVARYVPGDALFFVEQYDPIVTAKEFLLSPLGRKMSTKEGDERIEILGEGNKALGLVVSALKFLELVIAHKALRDLDIGHLSFAILPPQEYRPRPGRMDDLLLENLAFWCKTKEPHLFVEALTRLSVQQGHDKEVANSQYGSHSIRRLKVGHRTLSLAVLEHMLVFSLNETHLRRCIDVFDGERTTLADTARHLLSAQHGRNMRLQRRLVLDTAAVANFLGLPLEKTSLLATAGPISYREDGDAGSIHRRLRISDNSAQIEHQNSLESAPSVAAINSPLSRFVNEDAMLWLWSNSIPFAFLFDLKFESTILAPNEDDREVAGLIQETVGEITSLFSREFMVVADPNPEDVPLSLPLVLLRTTTGDPRELLSHLERLTSLYRIPVSFVEEQGFRYWYWSQSPAEGFCPLYGTSNDTFFLGNSRTLVHQTFTDQGYVDFPEMRKTDFLLSQNENNQHNNLFLEMRHDPFFASIHRLLQLMITLTTIENRDLALQYKEVFDTLLGPLLEGWRSNYRTLVHAQLAGGEIEIEMISRPEKRR